MKYEAYILAGGESSRFGSNKAFAPLGIGTVIEEISLKLKRVFLNVTVIAKKKDQIRDLNLPYMLDQYDFPGALAGLATAISNAKSQKIFVVSCDLPLLNTVVMERMASFAGDEDVLLPVINGYHQPLHALYDQKTINKLSMNIEKNRGLSMPEFIETLNCRHLDEKDFTGIPDFEKSFYNMNTRKDYENIS